jgi:hypothetical protein
MLLVGVTTMTKYQQPPLDEQELSTDGDKPLTKITFEMRDVAHRRIPEAIIRSVYIPPL